MTCYSEVMASSPHLCSFLADYSRVATRIAREVAIMAMAVKNHGGDNGENGSNDGMGRKGL